MSKALALLMAVAVAWAGWVASVARAAPESVPATAPVAAPQSAAVVGLSGEIDDYNRDSFFRRFNQAKAQGAKTVIVEIDTWGGLVTAGLDISRFLKGQTDVHTIAFVNDRAVSAGAMIAMACDEIVMTPVAMIGDCAPIARGADGSLQALPPAERAKLESPIAADFRESALRNHHDPLLAEAMVDVNVVVYWVQNPDAAAERRFVGQEEYDKLTAEGWTPVEGAPNPVDRKDRLLTVDTKLAVTLGLASGQAANADQLAQSRNMTIVANLHSGFGEAAVAWLNGGWVRMMLIAMFVVATYAALHAPGHGSAEAIAVTTLGLLLGVPLLAGYATWWEILLIVGGLAMVAFEIFVFPHAGIMIVGGVLMMLVGLVLTFVGGEPGGSRVLPQLPGDQAALKHGLMFVTGGMVSSALLCAWLSRFLPTLPYFGRLVLNETSGGTTSLDHVMASPSAPAWPAIGEVGRTTTPLRPGGAAEFPNATGTDVRVFSVVSESGFLPAGAPVVVREVGGGRVVVRSTVA